MLSIFKEKPLAGTVGCRLHFTDNTIQHDGIFAGISKKNRLLLTHENFLSYFNYKKEIKEVVGSTAALMMVRKNVFNICGGFNEIYSSCFEDVELNLKCLINGLKNYYDGNLTAYHYESTTRNLDDDKNKKMYDDYLIIEKFVMSNLDKLKKHLKYE